MVENQDHEIEDFCITQTLNYIDDFQQRFHRPVSAETMLHRINLEVDSILSNPEIHYSAGTEVLIARVKHAIEIKRSITYDPAIALVDKAADHIPWLEEAKEVIDKWHHWEAYRTYLREKQAAPEQLSELYRSTEKILSLLENPKRPAPWDVRGLIVGNIQAGKTSNYIGLLAKAVDAGYKVIIVLAGMTNDLRKQTQTRIDDGLLGYNSSTSETISRTSAKHPGRTIHAKTNRELNGDYGKASSFVNIRLDGEDAVLYVVKKNVSILRNIYRDLQNNLERNGKISAPMIMVDDEADNASVNGKQQEFDLLTGKPVNKEETNPAEVNKYIRAILSCFDRSAYVAYTATPYANIFIMPNDSKADRDKKVYDERLGREITIGEDLFPRNFIMEISPGSNYYGPEQIFGNGDNLGLPVVIPTSRFEREQEIIKLGRSGKTVKWIATSMPQSMRYAIDCFLISAAGKRVRNTETRHNTMLIHVDRLNATQREVLEWVKDYIDTLKDTFQVGTPDRQESFLEQLHEIWLDEYEPKFATIQKLTSDISLTKLEWEDVAQEIRFILSVVECLEINSRNGKKGFEYDRYPTGRTVIAVGGDKLARGLTLEGLSISYFMRHTRMYDSLLQMGRWFGYRSGYIDLSRIFASTMLIRNFEIITKANADLSLQFKTLAGLQPQKTPRDFGLMVQTDPNSTLLVTALNKSKNTTTRRISFSGNSASIPYILKDTEKNQENMERLKFFIVSLGRYSEIKQNAYVWQNVPSSHILQNFIEKGMHIDPQNSLYSYGALADYIKQMNKHGELVNWTVALIQGDGAKKDDGTKDALTVKFGADIQIQVSSRAIYDPEGDGLSYYEINQRRLPAGSNESIDLTAEQYEQALVATNEARARNGKAPAASPSPQEIRRARPASNALLLLYVLALHHNNKYVSGIFPSFMISFSESELGNSTASVTCQLNAIAEREYRKRFENEGN